MLFTIDSLISLFFSLSLKSLDVLFFTFPVSKTDEPLFIQVFMKFHEISDQFQKLRIENLHSEVSKIFE